MWYPSQQQQHSCYGYMHHYPSQQQQQQQETYSRTSYYCNTDELSTTCVEAINDENESPIHCQTTSYSSNVHVTTPNYYVTTSLNQYGDEMSSYQTTPTSKSYWNPVIVAPTKNMSINTPSVPIISSPSSSSSSSPPTITACWDWLLFSPQYYSEFYIPSSTFIHHQQKIEEKDDDDDNNNLNRSFLTTLPTCLLALLYLTPKLIHTSDDESHTTNESLLPSLPMNNIDDDQINLNRSSTPDTDDGYQSASDASRSDYSQQSSILYDHHNSRDNIRINEHSLPIPLPLMPRRISYAAAAVKPISTKTTTKTTTTSNKLASLSTVIDKPKQIINNTLSNIMSTNDILNTNGQKLKFIAPRFERMHHAKQHSTLSSSSSSSSSSSTLSNRTQIRSTNNYNNNNNNRNHIINSTRRR
ncbi:unnamed protein product [Adineta steineri]|uniref:Uncharacterized protein n=1 Tax=Adineta steineri TaxID=433720 RepID=A0A813NI85_9BILA|nr:unnamed protein product [Adineta steineri]